MAKALKCEYEIDIPEFSKVSAEARDLVQKLLLASPEERLTADQVMTRIIITITTTRMTLTITMVVPLPPLALG